MKELEELAVDVSNWTPSEVFSKLILDALVDARKLSGKITVFAEDITKGSGDTIKVRYFPARTAQGPISDGSSLTSTDGTAPNVYSITLAKYGDYAQLTDYSIFKAGDEVKARLLKAMGDALAKKFDEIIYSEIEGCTPGVTKTLSTSDWSSSSYDLYEKIVEARASLKANGANPDYLIIHPDFESYFLKETVEGVRGQVIKVENGNLVEVAGLKVIVTSVANAKSDTASEVQAIIIDSSRAVGEAWGKRPTFYEEYVPESDTYKEVVWAYFGASELDTNAIAHVVNPAA